MAGQGSDIRPSAVISVRVSPDERQAAEATAQALGLSLSEFGRRCIAGRPMPGGGERQALIRQLAGAGLTLREIAVEMKDGAVDVRRLEAAVDAITAAVMTLGR